MGADSEVLKKAIEAHKDYIANETLTNFWPTRMEEEYLKGKASIAGQKLSIRLRKLRNRLSRASEPASQTLWTKCEMIEFSCPNCQKQCQAPENMAGQEAECGGCGCHFIIPSSSLSTDAGQISNWPLVQNPIKPVYTRRIILFWKWAFSCLLLGFGTIFLIYYFVLYDTTVPLHPGFYGKPEYVKQGLFQDRVYNTGLMHNRMVGIGVGFGCLALGITFSILNSRKT